MTNRRLLGEFLVISPLVMLLGITIEARTSSPTFEPYSYNDEQQSQILAYRYYVTECAMAVRSQNTQRIRQAANATLDAIESGNLEALGKANYFDTGRAGVKGEISQTFDRISREMSRIAEKRFQSGDTDGGLDDIDSSIRLASAHKYSDLETIGYFALRERQTFQVIGAFVDQLSEAQIERVEHFLARLDVSDESVRQCSMTADRFYSIDGLRWNEARSRILDPLAKNQLVSNSGRRSVNQFSISSLSRPLFDQANCMRFAISSLNIERTGIAKLKRALEDRLARLDSAKESK